MVSLSALGVPSNSLSVNSKSVERVSGNTSVQSNMQRKLRLKTTKQYKFVTERSGNGGKPRAASSLAGALNESVQNSSSRLGSEGPSAGKVNMSTITAMPSS